MKCLARRLSDRGMLRLGKTWIEVPVEERDERGRQRTLGGKRTTKGTPQGGVISPRLANLTMDRSIQAFRRSGLGERQGAVLVSFADDFVVLCRREAGSALEATRRWMTTMRLALNGTKTHVRNARRESFDFLGSTFGPMHSPRTGTRYLGATPSKKALPRLQGHIRGRLGPSHQDPWDEVLEALNRRLRGWANDFGYGTVRRTRRVVDRHVYDRVRHFLRRRHKVRSRGTDRFPYERVFGELGVLSIQTLPKGPWTTANASV